MGKIYGYCRVSSKKQLNEGNGLEVQEKEILDKYENAIIRREQFTGATVDRPIFQSVIEDRKSVV